MVLASNYCFIAPIISESIKQKWNIWIKCPWVNIFWDPPPMILNLTHGPTKIWSPQIWIGNWMILLTLLCWMVIIVLLLDVRYCKLSWINSILLNIQLACIKHSSKQLWMDGTKRKCWTKQDSIHIYYVTGIHN